MRHVHRDHFAVRQFGGRAEHFEFGALGLFGNFAKLNTLDAEVRLIRAETGHRFMPRHHRIRIRQVNIDRFLEDIADHVFHDVADFLLREERCFNINLSEFRLAVRT